MKSDILEGDGLENRHAEGSSNEEGKQSEEDDSEITHELVHGRRTSRSLPELWRAVRNSWMVKESLMLLKLALPLFITNIFFQLPYFTTLPFVGHFSSQVDLDATLLGNTFMEITGFSVILGMALAADTLCPQSYGYKNYKRVGVILQRGLLILSVTCVPVVVICLNSESLLLLVKQDPCVVSITGKYVSIYILCLPSYLTYIMLTKYLEAQSLVVIFIGIGFISNVFVVLFCALFVVALHLGAIGASISLVLATTINTIIIIVYIKWRKLHVQTWGGWSFECLTEWWQFIRLGLPGILTLAFEWWSFEISSLVAGSISTTQLTISSTILQLVTLYYMAPLGMAESVTVRVGNELGAGNIVSARRSSYIALSLQTMFAIVLTATTLASRNYIGFIFTSNLEVVAGIGDTLITAIWAIFLDQIQVVISGVMRATGRQAVVAVINFCCYYIVGLPLGISLGLAANMKAKGIWLGLSVAELIQTITLFVLLLRTNWKKESEKAIKNSSPDTQYTSNSNNEYHSSSLETQDSGIDREADNNTTGFSEEENSDPSSILHSINQAENKTKTVAATVVAFANNLIRKTIQLYRPVHKKLEDVQMNKRHVSLEEEQDEDDYSNSNVDPCDDTIHQIPQNIDEEDIKRSNGLDSDNTAYTTGTKLYNSSTRFCQTRTSILLSKIAVLLACTVLLAGGGVLAATIRHHPKGCEDALNCSSVCYNVAIDVNLFNSPDEVITSPSRNIIPSLSSVYTDGDMATGDCLCEIMPTPMTFFEILVIFFKQITYQ